MAPLSTQLQGRPHSGRPINGRTLLLLLLLLEVGWCSGWDGACCGVWWTASLPLSGSETEEGESQARAPEDASLYGGVLQRAEPRLWVVRRWRLLWDWCGWADGAWDDWLRSTRQRISQSHGGATLRLLGHPAFQVCRCLSVQVVRLHLKGWWHGVVGNASWMKRSYSSPGPVST